MEPRTPCQREARLYIVASAGRPTVPAHARAPQARFSPGEGQQQQIARKDSTDMNTYTEPTVTEELHAVNHDYPGWHSWHSDEGRIYATRCRAGWCGTTLDAPTPALMRYEIAMQDREWATAAA
jgi:hypothetical protein